MERKPYRLEHYTSKGKQVYNLVKDITVKNKKTKVRVSLGHIKPTKEEVKKLSKKYAYALEAQAAEKRAKLSASLFQSKCLTSEQIINIERIRYLYKTFTSLLTTSEIKIYESTFEVNYVQGTTSIEGNTITTAETYSLLIDGILPKGKKLREINEVQNFKKVKAYRDSYNKRITLDFIKSLHSLIMDNIDYHSAGFFRRIDDIGIYGCDLPVTPAILIKDDLVELIDRYYRQLEEGVHPFEAAALFHYDFEMIHPFTDGNGRVGREIFNYMLKKCGYPRLLFLGEDRIRYIKSLKFGNKEKYKEMIQIFVEIIVDQRYHVLVEKLKDVVTPPKDTKQVRMDEFYKLPSRKKVLLA